MPTDRSPAPGPLTSVGGGLAIAVLAAVLVVAARSAPDEPGQRTGRRSDLTELIRVEQGRADRLAADAERLRDRVDAVRAAAPGDGVEGLQREVDAALGPAGLTPLQGPGVTVTLSDSGAPAESVDDADDLVVHEQDLQAVVNALWAGGADGVAVAGQRVTATTAIRCVGNVLLLGGRTYSPPYVVDAVGDGAGLRTALDADPTVTRYRTAARDVGLGYGLTDRADLTLPGDPESGEARVATPLAAAGP